MQLFRIVINWIILWLTGWSVWVILLKKGINYIKAFRITILYFLLLSLIVLNLYHNHLYTFFSRIPLKFYPFYFICSFFILMVGIYHFSRKIFGKKILSSNYKRKVLTAMMDYRYLVAKSFDIGFQQLIFLCLIISLQEIVLTTWIVILISGFIFGAAHIPLLITKHNALAPHFVIASFFAGFLFSFLMLFFPYGFIYSYSLHWSFYIVAGILFNVKIIKQNKSRLIL